jgi:pyruvate dehydrogenase E2 component (dihydrolipoamide acetyltransferase)
VAREFKLPDLGEGVSEGQVLRLLVAEGEPVKEDQPLLEVETDKAAVEIPSPHTGTIERWHVEERQTVNVGDVMVTFGEVDGDAATASKRDGTKSSKAERATEPKPTPAATQRGGDGQARTRRPASPAVRKLARELGIDLESIEGSGPGGRIVRTDVQSAASSVPSPSSAPAAPAPAAAPAARPVPSAPPPSQPVAAVTPVEPPGKADTDDRGPITRDPLSQTRKTIASVMSRAMSTIPHVTDCDDADVTELDRLRRGYNEGVAPEHKVGMLAFLLRAVVRALQMHPIINASLDESTGEIVYKRYYHIAIGVQTERGLIAPVLRDVDRMSIPQINYELAVLIDRTRSGKFTLDDTRGATYTISNAGAMGGSRYSTPIITPPQVAVLAAGRTRMQPWVIDGEVVPRLIMPLSHSMDHRVIDGAQEMAFMQQVIGDLENPARLML